MIINHNLAALNTYRQMIGNQGSAAKNIGKLSSGLRINQAGDDAAGLAISEKMRGQIRGLNQASRNAQDSISMIATAEGALSETHSILQRMRELAVQASSDTNTTSDRAEIQKEVNQLTSEINRIGNTTEFNTKSVLDGSIKQSAKGVSRTSFIAGGGINGLALESGARLATGNYTLSITGESGTRKTVTSGQTPGSTGVSNIDITKSGTLADGDYYVDVAVTANKKGVAMTVDNALAVGAGIRVSGTTTLSTGEYYVGITREDSVSSFRSGEGLTAATLSGGGGKVTESVAFTISGSKVASSTFSGSGAAQLTAANFVSGSYLVSGIVISGGSQVAGTLRVQFDSGASGVYVSLWNGTTQISTSGYMSGTAMSGGGATINFVGVSGSSFSGAQLGVSIIFGSGATTAGISGTLLVETDEVLTLKQGATTIDTRTISGVTTSGTITFSGGSSSYGSGFALTISHAGSSVNASGTQAAGSLSGSISGTVVVSSTFTAKLYTSSGSGVGSAVNGISGVTFTAGSSGITIGAGGTSVTFDTSSGYTDYSGFTSLSAVSGTEYSRFSVVTVNSGNTNLANSGRDLYALNVDNALQVGTGLRVSGSTTLSGDTAYMIAVTREDSVSGFTSGYGVRTITLSGAGGGAISGTTAFTISGTRVSGYGTTYSGSGLAAVTAIASGANLISGVMISGSSVLVNSTLRVQFDSGASGTYVSLWVGNTQVSTSGYISGTALSGGGANVNFVGLSGSTYSGAALGVTLYFGSGIADAASGFVFVDANETLTLKRGTTIIDTQTLSGAIASGTITFSGGSTYGSGFTITLNHGGGQGANVGVSGGIDLNFNLTSQFTANLYYVSGSGIGASVSGVSGQAFNPGTSGVTLGSGTVNLYFDTSSDYGAYSGFSSTGVSGTEYTKFYIGSADSYATNYAVSLKDSTGTALSGVSGVNLNGAQTGVSFGSGVGVTFNMGSGIAAGRASFTVASVSGFQATLTLSGEGDVGSKSIAIDSSGKVDFGYGLKSTGITSSIAAGDVKFSVEETNTNASLTMQIGSNMGQSFGVDVKDMRAKALGVSAGNADDSVLDASGKAISGASYVASASVSNGTDGTNVEYSLDLSTSSKATAAIKAIDNAIQGVSAERSKLGAFQNRLDHTINNLGTSAQNLTAAESRVRDVDMAKEMMEFTKNNILTQAAQAMMAQANQQPQGVLQLLR